MTDGKLTYDDIVEPLREFWDVKLFVKEFGKVVNMKENPKILLKKLILNRIKYGYIYVDMTMPLKSLGNILEHTGQILLLFKDDKTFTKIIIEKLLKNEIRKGLIPRTIAIQKNEPKERKPNLWERYKPMKNNSWKWYRTDVSQAQQFFIIMGFIFSAKLLANEFIWTLKDNKWKTKRYDSKPASNGNFNALFSPIAWLKKLVLLEQIGKSNLFNRFIAWFFSHYPALKPEEAWNRLLIFYTLARANHKYLKYLQRYITNNLEMIPRYNRQEAIKKAENGNIEELLRYCLRQEFNI